MDISQATINQFPSNLGCACFHYASPIHGIQNAKMQKSFFVTSSLLYSIEYWNDDVTKNFVLHISILNTMYLWSMMKNIHIPNLVEICSWGPMIWLHECISSPIEISVNWPGSQLLWTRPIYTDFNGANYVFKWPHEQISPIFGCGCFSLCFTDIWYSKCWNAIKKFFVTSSLWYSIL